MRVWLLRVIFCALPLVAQDGTATVSGQLRDIRSIAIPGAGAELRSENPPGRLFKAITNDSGTFVFSGLPPDEYTLKVGAPGFKVITITGIVLADAERKAIPALALRVGIDCGEHASPEYLRLLSSDGHGASFRGTVKVGRGSGKPYGRPVKGAQVTLVCPSGAACGTAKTDGNGGFQLPDLPAGNYSLRVQHSGFYSLQASGYDIQAGFEWNSWPVSIEHCPLGDCDPRKRPRRPPNICE